VQESFPMIQGKTYVFEFDARAASNRLIEPRVAQNGGSYIVYSKTGPVVVSPQMTHYQYQFQMTDPTDYNARVVLNCGLSNITCYFDNVSVKEFVPSGVAEKGAGILEEFILYTNYPNPFNPVTTIRYALPEPGHVAIEVFNVAGEQVGTVHDARQDAGLHQVEFDGTTLASGVYFCRVEFTSLDRSRSLTRTEKMLLLK
jgi:hypothetical protein